MDSAAFNKMAEGLDDKINMVEEFIDRAHEEGISTVEAIAMQNHVRREFSPKQREKFRQQIKSLYRDDKISIEQKEKMDQLLDRASKVADKHFLKLSRIVPESQAITAPHGFPGFMTQKPGANWQKKLLGLFGIGN